MNKTGKPEKMGKPIGQLIIKLWGQQLGFLLLASGLLTGYNSLIALCVLLGGLIYWIPNAYFTLYAFRFRGAQAAAAVLRSMYRGETGKFMLTVVGFALVFTLVKPIEPISLFVSYSVMTISQWVLVSRWP